MEEDTEIDYDSYYKTIYRIGNFDIDTTMLQTDDIAHIILEFKDSPDELEDMIEYISELPYILSMDVIYYLTKNKEDFEKLCENESFSELIDSFAEKVFMKRDTSIVKEDKIEDNE